jgi:hypothetical protein
VKPIAVQYLFERTEENRNLFLAENMHKLIINFLKTQQDPEIRNGLRLYQDKAASSRLAYVSAVWRRNFCTTYNEHFPSPSFDPLWDVEMSRVISISFGRRPWSGELHFQNLRELLRFTQRDHFERKSRLPEEMRNSGSTQHKM